MDFFVSSITRRTAPSVTLIFVSGNGRACKNRRGRYQFPISGVNRDISISIINTDISQTEIQIYVFN